MAKRSGLCLFLYIYATPPWGARDIGARDLSSGATLRDRGLGEQGGSQGDQRDLNRALPLPWTGSSNRCGCHA